VLKNGKNTGHGMRSWGQDKRVWLWYLGSGSWDMIYLRIMKHW